MICHILLKRRDITPPPLPLSSSKRSTVVYTYEMESWCGLCHIQHMCTEKGKEKEIEENCLKYYYAVYIVG